MTDRTPAIRSARLERLCHAKHDLTPGQQKAFDSYLVGALTGYINDDDWCAALREARDLALFEAARVAAVSHR